MALVLNVRPSHCTGLGSVSDQYVVKWHWEKFLSKYFSFLCQCDSINDLWSFVHMRCHYVLPVIAAVFK
jgi:hypothetical protein